VSTTTDTEVHGPVDFLLLEFPRNKLTGDASVALADLVERGVVRLYDLTVISKDKDGKVEVLELTDPASGAGGFSYFAGARSGLIRDSDMQEAAAAMMPDTVAALLIYENSWAIPFVRAASASGGQVIASQRIPATDVAEALDALELST
jgi:hypothetical protein